MSFTRLFITHLSLFLFFCFVVFLPQQYIIFDALLRLHFFYILFILLSILFFDPSRHSDKHIPTLSHTQFPHVFHSPVHYSPLSFFVLLFRCFFTTTIYNFRCSFTPALFLHTFVNYIITYCTG